MISRFMSCLMMATTLLSCGQPSEETRILDVVNSIEKRVEKKDQSGLMAHLADDYRDFKGRDKQQTEDLVEEIFKRRQGIVVHLLHTRLDEIRDGTEATIETDVALSSGGAEVLRKVIRFAGEFYRFKLDLRKSSEGWKIIRAEWEDLSADDLFPESGPILKKLSPDFRTMGRPRFSNDSLL